MVFHWSLSDSKSRQISRTHLSIQADLINAAVCMVSARPSISISSSFLTKPFGIVPSSLITISITITFMFFSFLSSLARSKYLSLFFGFFDFLSVDGKAHYSVSSLFPFFFKLLQILVSWLGLGDSFASPNPREFYASHSPGRIPFWLSLVV